MNSLRFKIAFGGFLIIALAELFFGIRYSLANEIMPYHLEAIGSNWENLNPNMQVMLLNFMKSAAAGFLTTGIAILFLLFFPFRKGEAWASYALFAVSINELALIAFRTYQVKIHTPGEPPLTGAIIITCIAIASFILSIRRKANLTT